MGTPLVLSLFPGADLLGMAFEQEGFCVVRGPDILLGSDIRSWHAVLGRFDGVIGGPPCKPFSAALRSQGGPAAATEGNLIPEFERIVEEARPAWWLMENVPGAPVPAGAVYSEILDAHAFGAAQHRRRRFSLNVRLELLPVSPEERHPDPWPCVTASEWRCTAGSGARAMRQRAGRKVGRRMTLAEVNVAMGLPEDFSTPALLNTASYAVRGNGVPLPMGRALARAVRQALTCAPGRSLPCVQPADGRRPLSRSRTASVRTYSREALPWDEGLPFISTPARIRTWTYLSIFPIPL